MIHDTISDQVRLWEIERQRITTDVGYMYEAFQSKEQFEATVEHAEVWRANCCFMFLCLFFF